MSEFTPWSSFVGGLMIGAASALALLLNGRVPGISGVFGRIFRGVRGDTAWRVVFVAGLLVGGAVAFRLLPASAAFGVPRSLVQLALAGFLVGVGTRVGGGCTSGHGVCGIGRGSRRSLAATATFMATGFLTVYLLHHVLGATP